MQQNYTYLKCSLQINQKPLVPRVVSLKTEQGSKGVCFDNWVKLTSQPKRCGLGGETSQTQAAGWRQSEAKEPQATGRHCIWKI